MAPVPAALPTNVGRKCLAFAAGLLLAAGLLFAAAAGAAPRPAKPPLVAKRAVSWAHPARLVAGADQRAAARGAPAPAARSLSSAGLAPGTGGGPVVYQAPLPTPLQVLRGFDPPATRFGPGHLGVDLAVPPHTPIGSAGPGVVLFAGPVAGRGVVVVSHPDGVRTEYEPVRPLVHRGDEVQVGTVIGLRAGRHAGCPVTACLHWGARRGGAYIDPLGLLAPLAPVRLLPWNP